MAGESVNPASFADPLVAATLCCVTIRRVEELPGTIKASRFVGERACTQLIADGQPSARSADLAHDTSHAKQARAEHTHEFAGSIAGGDFGIACVAVAPRD